MKNRMLRNTRSFQGGWCVWKDGKKHWSLGLTGKSPDIAAAADHKPIWKKLQPEPGGRRGKIEALNQPAVFRIMPAHSQRAQANLLQLAAWQGQYHVAKGQPQPGKPATVRRISDDGIGRAKRLPAAGWDG